MLAPCCSQLVSETRIGSTPECVTQPRIRDCCRRISSKSYLEGFGSHPRALCLLEFPPRPPGRVAARFRRGKTSGGLAPARVTGKPREQPRRSAFPGNPSPGALREGPGLRKQTARLPGGGSETQLKSITAGERRAGSSEKERPGNPAPPPYLGMGN